jgi:putative DNA primase/helicase
MSDNESTNDNGASAAAIVMESVEEAAAKATAKATAKAEKAAAKAKAVAVQAKVVAAAQGAGPSAVDPTQFRQTDVGNAALLVAMFGEDLRYVDLWRTWMWWDAQRWVEASDTAIIPLATKVTEHMFGWAAGLDEEARTKLRKHAFASQKKERLMAMITLAKGDKRVRAKPDIFDADPWMLGCEGMTVDLRTNALHRARREDYITKSTGVIPVPRKVMDCPNWLAHLAIMFDGDAETIEHVQRMCGYILTGDVSEEVLFAFFGGGSNGKTTLVTTLMEMMGDYAGKARSTLLMEAQGLNGSASPDLAALSGKRLVVVSETGDNCALAEAQVKAITSNEPITARGVYRDPFTFMPTHKTILMTNHRPFVKGMDDGIWRRLNIVPCLQQFDGAAKITNYRETLLRPELPAILMWAIKGCAMWRSDGLKPSLTVKAATHGYRAEMDFISHWLEERAIGDQNARAVRTEAYGDYKTWAEVEGVPTISSRRFYEEMHSRGYPQKKLGGVRMLMGLRLGSRGPGLQVITGGLGDLVDLGDQPVKPA